MNFLRFGVKQDRTRQVFLNLLKWRVVFKVLKGAVLSCLVVKKTHLHPRPRASEMLSKMAAK